MKIHNCMKLLVIGIAALAMFSDIQAQANVLVTCDQNCVIDDVDPDPVNIIVGWSVRWMISASCVGPPPSFPQWRTVTIPAQPPGFPTAWTGAGAASYTPWSPPFTSPGTYNYTITSPQVYSGTIIVTSPDVPAPTLTEWGMIIFCALLFGWMAWVIVRRRRRVTISS